METTESRLKLLYQLFKPGLAFSIVVTVVPALLLEDRIPSLELIFYTLLGTGLSAMASFAYNQLLEQHTDAKMKRTARRVLPSGKLDPILVHVIGSSLLGAGILILYIKSGWLAAALALFSFLFYVFIYTLLLKPHTEHSTVLGGICGAIGPLIGEAALRGTITIEGILLFLLVFLWQPPHFWALSIFRLEDYRSAGFPLLPVKQGIPVTVQQMIFYQALLVIAMILVWFPADIGSYFYLVLSVPFGLYILYKMVLLRKEPSPVAARSIFFLTIFHNILWHGSLTAELLLRHW
ncbi:MAG TPA: protoheme IX farnesyltransferase [Leptospiraceae bacterium]|nr:protoheme IX farnesyltransferase [Leptospiraceae bacterium]|tara:strand:+ start:22653 stop:23531 length:879 start_codon:yes stop_codon:yes gene_type:complete